jgi:ATP-binding cassette subfamily B protein
MKVRQENIVSKVRAAIAQVQFWPRTLRLIWAAAPRWTLAWAILLCVQGVLPAAVIYLSKLVVDSLVIAMRLNGAWPQVRHTLVLVLIAAGVLLATELLQGAIEWVRAAQSELIQDHIKNLVHQQSAIVDLAFYDSHEFHDRLDRARSEATSRPLSLLENGGALMQNGITLVTMSLILISYSAWLPVILFISTLPALYVVLSSERHYHQWWQQTTAVRRWIQYYDVMLTHADAAPEMRLFSLGSYFQTEYQRLRGRLRGERLKQIRKQNIGRLTASTGALFVAGLAMAWMCWRALHGVASLGDLALFYQAFNRGQDLMRSLLGNVGQILSNSLYLGNLFSFLDLKPQVVDPKEPIPAPLRLRSGISFKQVTFRYPKSTKAALQNFSLSIPAGKIVAIVGVNGAGKSTLLKLLCRFYDPEAGCIELDGIDIKDLTINSLWKMITILPQFPLHYHATVAQSIAFGDLSNEHEMADIEAAARGAMADELINQLPQGYDTLLGKWFADGVDLSGGERQRLALARAYLRQSPIMLLDEPTSAMDSWAEADWFKRFRQLVKNRTAVVITHRFTIAMRADIIHVMHEGEVLESGTHHELLARNGFYAESWNAQMQAAGIVDVRDVADVKLLFDQDLKMADIGS